MAGDRTYFRMRCPDHQEFELFHDGVSGLWVLNLAHDWHERRVAEPARDLLPHRAG